MKFRDYIKESTGEECEIYKANNNKWYLELGSHTYGPFNTEEDAHRELKRHPNPGGFSMDDSGDRKPPKETMVRRGGRYVLESMSRHCYIYKAKNNKWYVELANKEHGGREDATTYGPFNTEKDAHEELENHVNPGSFWIDDDGKIPVPKKSPNGEPIQAPSRGSFPSPWGGRGRW